MPRATRCRSRPSIKPSTEGERRGDVLPKLHLALEGFEPGSLARESFPLSHNGVVDEVVAGRADFGATFCTIAPRVNRIVHAARTAPAW